MDSALKYHFNAAEKKAYQKSTNCQNVTNHSFTTRHFMMKRNTVQSNGYQPVKLYICLQIAKFKVSQPTAGQYNFTELSQVYYINNFETYLL